jgi:hypothetical protein
MNCQLQEMTTTYNRSQGAVYAEAKLLLASIVTVPSNGVVFHMCHQRPMTQDNIDGSKP